MQGDELIMRTVFWGTAVFVLAGLVYVIIIGALHR
jgi:hypothetical protein